MGHRQMREVRRIFFVFFILLFFGVKGWAYGPIAVNTDGTPMKHANISDSSALKWTPENGPVQDSGASHTFATRAEYDSFCASQNGGGGGGCSLNPLMREAHAAISSNAEANTLMAESFATWDAVSDASVSFSQDGSLGVDVNVCNYTQYIDAALDPINGDSSDPRVCGCLGTCSSACRNVVVYDANGDIFGLEYGEGNRGAIIGSAGPIVWPGRTNFLKFEALINGVCLEDSPDTTACRTFRLTNSTLKAVMIHELGHALGLAHVQVNGASIQVSSSGEANVKASADPEAVPTMYPILVKKSDNSGYVDMTTLHKDDQIGLSHLYPKSSLTSSYCKAKGTIYKGTSGQRCVEVVLRESGNTILGAISFITGAEVANDSNPSQAINSCAESNTQNCGNYEIQGLTVGKTYTIEVNAIPNFPSGSTIGPCGSNNPSFSGVSQNGGTILSSSGTSISCSSAGSTIVCSGGSFYDTDLCRTIPTIP